MVLISWEGSKNALRRKEGITWRKQRSQRVAALSNIKRKEDDLGNLEEEDLSRKKLK